VDAPRDLLQILDRTGQTAGSMGDLPLERRKLGRHRGLLGAQLERQRDEPLLGAVVQVTLDPATGLVAGGDDSRANVSAMRISARPSRSSRC
jgi:hypothetical protein